MSLKTGDNDLTWSILDEGIHMTVNGVSEINLSPFWTVLSDIISPLAKTADLLSSCLFEILAEPLQITPSPFLGSNSCLNW